MNIKLAFFDIDGTLISRVNKNKITLKSRCFNYALSTVFGLDNVNYVNILGKKLYGQTDRSILRLTLNELGFSDNDYYDNEDSLFDAVDVYFEKYQEELQYGEYELVPGVYDLIELFNKNDIRLGLVTGNIKKHADWKIRGAKLEPYFLTGAFGDDGEKREDILQAALNRNSDIPINEICHFGDSPQDLIAAQSLGLKVVAITDIGGGTHSRDELGEVGYGMIIDSWFDVNGIEDYFNLNY